LRNLLDWSYDLLAPAYRPFFARLAVFMGGGTLDAIEAICVGHEDSSVESLDGLAALVNASLLRSVDDPSGETRFTMLETIREYAWELLEDSSGLAHMRQQHARYFLSLAEEAAPPLRSAHNREWLDRLERDHDNLRAALQWACDHGQIEMLARFVGALWQFWHVHGHRQEARRWVDATLTKRTSLSPAVAANALYGAGWLANDRREYQQAALYFEESLALLRQMGNTVGIPEVLRGLGELALSQADYVRAQALFDESLVLGTELGSTTDRAWSLHHLGRIALEQGADERALASLRESLVLFGELGDAAGVAWSTHNLGRVALAQAVYDQAEQWLRQSLQLFDELGDKAGRAWSLQNLGRSALDQNDVGSAVELLHESLALFQELGDELGSGWSLYTLGRAAATQGDRERAAAYFADSLVLFRKVGDKPGIEWATFHQGQLVTV
jgi:tetratricopeptide (TPR) repeat protein